MKKLVLTLAILAGALQIAGAQQVKSVAAAKSAVEAAQKAADDAKKNTKAATWVKLGQTLIEAYEAPAGAAWVGSSKQEVALVMGNEKPTSTKEVELQGQVFTKETYATKNLYFTPNGQLAMKEITAPIYADALERAAAAFAQAAKLDEKGQKTKDIVAGLDKINQSYIDDAYNSYTMGDYAKASVCFAKAAEAAAMAPKSALDTNSIYNAGFTANLAGDFARAEKYLEKAVAANYGTDGEAYAKLAEVQEKLGKKEESKTTLETGFTKFPQSQSILVGLINYYVTSGQDSDRLFQLLDEAKKNEPGNASLYYVEGNIHKQLGQIEEAVKSYAECAKVNPAYEFGYIGQGILYYEQAIDLQEKASNEMDDAKYTKLVAEFETALKNCIEPFETAFNTTADGNLKVSISEYLKNACYRFSSEDAYKAKYDKYSAVVAKGSAE